jgi:DNA-binding NarL/FixJ family response regulator
MVMHQPRPRVSKKVLRVCALQCHPVLFQQLTESLRIVPKLEVVAAERVLLPAQNTECGHVIYIIDLGSLPATLDLFVEPLRLGGSDVSIIALGNPLNAQELYELLWQGIHGFVSYKDVVSHLPNALKAVRNHRLWFQSEVLEYFARCVTTLERENERSRNRFTGKERKVLGLLCSRLSNKEIGCVLGISERTVRFHLGNVFSKLGVHDRNSVVEVLKGRNWFLMSAGRDKTPSKLTSVETARDFKIETRLHVASTLPDKQRSRNAS